ncbi:unnamed protein product [Rangifer tarandus platyrhynchus]|uniref:Uncharacterized protein n=1 Tax=Rangifer tarandus platyrhynchus TaxID=3082113 RepID=A0ACB1KEK2_RANTA
MLLFISTGTYFKLLDLEISGDLEILEMIGDDICIYMFIYIYIYVCVCVYIYTYMEIIHFILNMLALSLFTLRCSQIPIFGGQAIFSHINYFLNQGRMFKPGIQFWHKMFPLKS